MINPAGSLISQNSGLNHKMAKGFADNRRGIIRAYHPKVAHSGLADMYAFAAHAKASAAGRADEG